MQTETLRGIFPQHTTTKMLIFKNKSFLCWHSFITDICVRELENRDKFAKCDRTANQSNMTPKAKSSVWATFCIWII